MSIEIEVLKLILLGAGAGAFAAFVGYMKALFGPNQEPFDPVKFGDMVALGAILGGIAGYFGFTTVEASNLLQSLGLLAVVTYFVDAGIKALVRYIRAHIEPAPVA